ncbi:MAG: methylenetetrahydrofolate--tRNA-(uracil(54)-C(5))-methyltransferase (FADH(2)-oxidizing) TrmFO, partial [Geobacteraceae bacterium]
LGALARHITNAEPRHFQPMNVNYGLFPELPGRVKKKEKRAMLAGRALADLTEWMRVEGA